jgi:hypothetical protein
MLLKIRRTSQKIFEKYYWGQLIGKLTIETRRICWFRAAATSGIVGSQGKATLALEQRSIVEISFSPAQSIDWLSSVLY